MTKTPEPAPSFNLWTSPWIELERPDGDLDRQGLEQALLQAHSYRAIYEPSPLVVVGIHRLLVAILQAALAPEKNADLKRLWRSGQFPAKAIREFGLKYVGRFDLYSREAPFLQSADIPLAPTKEAKTVAYLAPEVPAGTAGTHYRHGSEKEQALCPTCTAGGLAVIPAFATSGGAGIKPSINGVPPLYVLPGGASLFESLASSLLTSAYWPKAASHKKDEAWWVRRPTVARSQTAREVGYLHSLTFAARRVRVFPERLDGVCTRCGRPAEWGVRQIVFEMGESRSKEAAFWLDPFAAYRLPEKGKARETPTPIRPSQGRATWREFAGLFLHDPQTASGNQKHTVRPAVLDQLADLNPEDRPLIAFRCVGLRTDMKAKIFEWVDTGFEVPPPLLRDETAHLFVQDATDLASRCAGTIAGTFREVFGGRSKKAERHKALKTRMGDDYWAVLAGPFRELILQAAEPARREPARRQWADIVTTEAEAAFRRAAEELGDDGATLGERARGERLCRMRLANQRKEYLNE